MQASRPGSRPGQLKPQPTAARVRHARYSEAGLAAELRDSFDALPAVRPGEGLWLDIEGVPGEAGLLALQQAYGLHGLALEDVQSGGQSPKLEDFGTHLYLVLQMPRLEAGRLEFDQLNLFLAEGLVISIHARRDLFDPVRARLEGGRGQIRTGGAEYLLYALCDLAVDLGFPVTQELSEVLIELEGRVEDGDADLSSEIYSVRRQLSGLQRQSQRQREELRSFLTPDHPLLAGRHEVYWRDCVDHADRVYEGVTYLRESAADLLNTHLALISHRMNDVMKVLTIISTTFVPLSFLVGLYGMNFSTDSPWNMPELSWRFGYLYIWGVMLLVIAGVLVFFRRKRWI